MFKQLLFLVILMFIPSLSFAQLADHNFETSIEEGQLYIIVQTQIRDVNHNLGGYIETDRITVEHLDALFVVLDDMSANPDNMQIMIINNEKYQVITGVGNAKYLSDTFVSRSAITNDGNSLAYVNYDGFKIMAGEFIITTWTMVRPA